MALKIVGNSSIKNTFFIFCYLRVFFHFFRLWTVDKYSIFPCFNPDKKYIRPPEGVEDQRQTSYKQSLQESVII